MKHHASVSLQRARSAASDGRVAQLTAGAEGTRALRTEGGFITPRKHECDYSHFFALRWMHIVASGGLKPYPVVMRATGF